MTSANMAPKNYIYIFFSDYAFFRCHVCWRHLNSL